MIVAVFSFAACLFLFLSHRLDEKANSANYREFYKLTKRSEHYGALVWVACLTALLLPGGQGLWVIASCVTLRIVLGVTQGYEGSPSNHRG